MTTGNADQFGPPLAKRDMKAMPAEPGTNEVRATHPVTIRLATERDATAITNIHRAALRGRILPALGQHYLQDVYWPRLLRRPDISFTLVANNEQGQTVGFITMGYEGSRINAFASQFSGALIFSLIAAICRNPSILSECLSLARGVPFHVQRTSHDVLVDVSNFSELFTIAVDPDAQKQGIGHLLIENAMRRVPRPIVVRTSSADARRFYLREGFELLGEERRGRIPVAILMLPDA